MKESPTLQKEIKRGRPFEVLEEEVYLNLLRTASVLSAGPGTIFKTVGISAPLHNILRILRGAGDKGLPSLEIAQRMVTRVPDITRLVDRLERQGLATRSRIQEDRRVVLVRITEKGKELIGRLEQPLLDLQTKQLANLSPEELHTLNELLVKARQKPV
jgi:DNA-binding MarR family transcriptional regulator